MVFSVATAMNVEPAERVPLNRQLWDRFTRMVKRFIADSEMGRIALLRFGLLILFLFGINGLNVVNSYVGRDFMTAIADRDKAGFVTQALYYIAVFAALTVVAVISRYTEESLGLLWREWLTRRMLDRYLGHKNYYRLGLAGEIGNPDQRIAEDARAFTVTTLSFMLMLLNSSFTIVAFSGVLWTISPLLFVVAVLYAVTGSYLAIRLGRPLIRLNYDQLDKEADFRSSLIQVRENADAIALLGREGRLHARLLRRLGDLAANFRKIIRINRNLGFFTTGYNWLIQIIPALLVAPLYFDGKVEFGVVTQAAMAFSVLLGAFSLIVTQFQSISSFAAVIARLGALAEAIDAVDPELRAEAPAIEIVEDEGQVAYERLTLRSPRSGRTLVGELSVAIPHGRRVLVAGPDETARAGLLRATAGLWDTGEGRIARPAQEHIMFLPERPYLHSGTLRELLLRSKLESEVPDERIRKVLGALNIESIPARFGGLDTEHRWGGILPLGEQQLLAAARLILAAPRFAFLYRPESALDLGDVERLLDLFVRHSISYVVFDETVGSLGRYDAVLELLADGRWRWSFVENGRMVVQKKG
jgi:putative ATP-binding cassette transporter